MPRKRVKKEVLVDVVVNYQNMFLPDGMQTFEAVSPSKLAEVSTYFKAELERNPAAKEVNVTQALPIQMKFFLEWMGRDSRSESLVPPEFNMPLQAFVKLYQIGHVLGAPYFQDAMMNEIVRYFRPGLDALPTELVNIIYNTDMSNGYIWTDNQGMKKFLTDYYVFITYGKKLKDLYAGNIDIQPQFEALQKINVYFASDVEGAVRKFLIPRNSFKLEQYLYRVPDFKNLEEWLKTKITGVKGYEAEEKCRYHSHGNNVLCWNVLTTS